MLNSFIKVAYQQSRAEEEREQATAILRKLPQETLFKIASGELKMAFDDCGDGDKTVTWLEQFKDTPLFEKALQLEQQALQTETLQQQHDQQQKAERNQREQSEPDFYALKDQIRLQKKMLGLELASLQLQAQGGGIPPSAPPPASPATQPAPAGGAQGAGAPGPETEPPGPKLAAAGPTKKKAAAELVDHAIILGQKLAHADAQKAAKLQAGAEVGAVMAKAAGFDLSALGGLGQKAVGLAAKHPGAVLGGAVGAAGGLSAGMQKDEHGQRHLMRGLAGGAVGGAAGAAAGHVAQGTGNLMGQGLGAGEALRTSAGVLGNQVRSVATNAGANMLAGAKDTYGRARGQVPPQMGG